MKGSEGMGRGTWKTGDGESEERNERKVKRAEEEKKMMMKEKGRGKRKGNRLKGYPVSGKIIIRCMPSNTTAFPP